MKPFRTILIFIVCVAAAAPLFMPAYFLASRSLIRYEMMERMEKQKLSSVQVPVEEFQWFEKDREILIDGKMFDVKSIRLQNGIYHIAGLFDEQETELELALQKKMESSDIPQQLVQFCTIAAEFDTYFFELTSPDPVFNSDAEYRSPHFPMYCKFIVTPPPKAWLT